ncbi:MAG: preprotein translocase subunit YajC [Alphaproteobacteria bacterium]|nr:preprotein translocase subunit YajC [Alphaproteobacteria bacterium]
MLALFRFLTAAVVVSAALAAPARAQAPAPGGGDIIAQLFPLILIFVVFWFLLIRPQMKRAKEHRAMTQNLKRGDKIITGGGLHGKVTHVDDESETVKVEISEDVEVKVSRSTIAANLTQVEAQAAARVTPPRR